MSKTEEIKVLDKKEEVKVNEKKEEIKIIEKKEDPRDKVPSLINILDKTVENLFTLGKIPYDTIIILYSIRARKDQLLKDVKLLKKKYSNDDFILKPDVKRVITQLTLPELIGSYVEFIKDGHSRGGVTFDVAIQLKSVEMDIKKALCE